MQFYKDRVRTIWNKKSEPELVRFFYFIVLFAFTSNFSRNKNTKDEDEHL